MIEFIIGLIMALVGGAFMYGRSSSKNSDAKEVRKSRNIETRHDQKSIDDVRRNSSKWVRK